MTNREIGNMIGGLGEALIVTDPKNPTAKLAAACLLSLAGAFTAGAPWMTRAADLLESESRDFIAAARKEENVDAN